METDSRNLTAKIIFLISPTLPLKIQSQTLQNYRIYQASEYLSAFSKTFKALKI